MSKNLRDRLSQDQKFLGFQRAFDTITAYRSTHCWLSAYVVAFSVFEDRLKAARFLIADLHQKRRPSGHLKLYRLVDDIKNAGRIGEAEARRWKAAGDRRNELLHAAMWTVDAVQDKDVLAVVRLARAADAVAAKLKREVKQRQSAGESDL